MAKKAATTAKKKTSVAKKDVLQNTKKKILKKSTAKPTTKASTKTKAKAKVAAKPKKKVSAIPKGYNSITPYLTISNANSAIDFYKRVFDAKEMMRMERQGGKIGHAELKIGDSKIMLSDECPEMNTSGPQTYGGSAVTIHLYVKNVDAVVERAVAAGAKLMRPVEDMFYGDRGGMFIDPYGHQWYVATHIEDVTPAKMKKRAAEAFAH